MARRGLTPPRGNGFFATVNFGDKSGRRPLLSPKFTVANMPRRPSAVTRRGGAKRSTRHSASPPVVRFRGVPWRYGELTVVDRRGAAVLARYAQRPIRLTSAVQASRYPSSPEIEAEGTGVGAAIG